MRWLGIAVAMQLGTSACAASHDVGPGVDGDKVLPLPVELSRGCLQEIADAPFGLPDHLSCTGLYRDANKKLIAEGIDIYAPAYLLWSDGLAKVRYLFQPKGTKIDASNPGQWKFPVGTRVWKEFQDPDTYRPVETRIYVKVDDDRSWNATTYEWNASLSDATRVDARKDVMVGSLVHTLPSPTDCAECHKGRRDLILGFEQVSLGLPGATGLTLDELVAQNRLTGFEGPTQYQIGEDPESAEAHALGFLHENCGVSCHNDNSNSTGHMVNMRLKLDPAQLDGRPVSGFDTFKTTVGVATQSTAWLGNTRITAGSPDDSWLVTLMTSRGDPKRQMPPLATNVVDEEDSEWVRTWIASLPEP